MTRCENTLFGLMVAIAVALTAACAEQDWDISSTADDPAYTLEEFVAALNVIEFDGDSLYLYKDMQFESLDEAEDFYWATWNTDGALLLNGGGALDTRRIESDIRYCISNSFGSAKNAIRDAMATAANNWSSAANLNFTYDSSRDGNCDSRGSIDIAVRPTSGSFIASAFFPRRGNAEGNLLVVVDQFFSPGLSAAGVMRHELGHILGFRHEHTRFRDNPCYENGNWTALTEYDSSSTMHYPQCDGTGSFGSLALTSLDRQGARSVYGRP